MRLEHIGKTVRTHILRRGRDNVPCARWDPLRRLVRADTTTCLDEKVIG